MENTPSMFSGLASGAFDYFNNPFDDVLKKLKQIPSTVNQYYDPYTNSNDRIRKLLMGYLDRGNQAGSSSMNNYNMMSNPMGAQNLMSSLTSNFQSSPGYNYRVRQATDAANRVASANGMLGSPGEQFDLSNQIGQMANEDYGNYFDRASQIYNRGLSGLDMQSNLGASTGMNEYNTNANMTNQQAQLLAQNILNEALTSGQSTDFADKAMSKMFSFLI